MLREWVRCSDCERIHSARAYNQRIYPQIHLFRPMKLMDRDGTKVKANLRDLCPSGLRAITNPEAAQELTDGFASGENGAPARVAANFNLPIDDDFIDITIQCRVAHVSQVPEEAVAIGLKFVYCEQADLANLNRFILCSLEPA